MLAVVQRIIHPRKRLDAPVVVSRKITSSNAFKPHAINEDDERALARSLAEALDEAIALGRLNQTKVIAQSARRIAHRHPQLTERLARLQLAADDADAALDLIDACRERTDSLRLLRCACLLQSGRIVEAHQDLSVWCHHSSAPIEARQLLAILEWEQGDLDAASIHLRNNLCDARVVDDKTLMLLTCLAAERGSSDEATKWAERLRQATWRRDITPDVNILIQSLGVNSVATAMAPTTEQLGALATELLAAESAIPALVESLEMEFDPAIADMLASGIERGIDEFASPAVAIEALAKLNIMLERYDRAAQWIERGRVQFPLSATLSLLEQAIAQRTETPKPQPRTQTHRVKRSAAA